MERITKFRDLLKLEKGALALDDNHNGLIDPQEGVVVSRCKERFLVEAADSYLQLNPNKTLYIPQNNLRLPYDLRLSREETTVSLKKKIGAGASLGREMRSREVFAKVAGLISQELAHVIQQRRFTVLYPASGAHMAPLETFFGLIDQNFIDSGKLIMTEIAPAFSKTLKENLAALKEAKVIEDYIVSPVRCGGGSSFEETLVVTYKGKEIQILFAANMSDREYYRPEYFANADAIFLHDVDAGWKNNATLLSKIFKDRALQEKPQIILLENEIDSFEGLQQNWDLTFLNHARIEGSYGHYGPYEKPDWREKDYEALWDAAKEKGYPLYRSALLLRADQPLLKGLSGEEIDGVFRMATLWTHEDSSVFPAGLNDSACDQSYLRAFGGDEEFYITGEQFIRFSEIIEGWFKLPEEILPRQKKEELALRLLGYLWNNSPKILEENQWKEFYAMHRPLYAAMSASVYKHSKKLPLLSSDVRKNLMKMLAGVPPSDDFNSRWEISRGLKEAVAKMAAHRSAFNP